MITKDIPPFFNVVCLILVALQMSVRKIKRRPDNPQDTI